MAAGKKARLDITIRPEFKEMARQMAKERRRSISALFEDLLEAENKREKEAKEQRSIGFHWPKDCPDEGHCANCRGIVETIQTGLLRMAPTAAVLAMLGNEMAA